MIELKTDTGDTRRIQLTGDWVQRLEDMLCLFKARGSRCAIATGKDWDVGRLAGAAAVHRYEIRRSPEREVANV